MKPCKQNDSPYKETVCSLQQIEKRDEATLVKKLLERMLRGKLMDTTFPGKAMASGTEFLLASPSMAKAMEDLMEFGLARL